MEFPTAFKKVCLKVLCLCIIVTHSLTLAADTPQIDHPKIFHYNDLPSSSVDLIQEFHDKGYVAVKGVPNFPQAYQEFISSARAFITLPLAEKNKFKSLDTDSRGWWDGTETLNGVQDSHKGSYYAWLPEENCAPNIWPEVHNFEASYKTLAGIMYKIGKEVLSIVESPSSGTKGLGRMLYYSPAQTDDGNANWCGKHLDHGLFTVLCPEIYEKEGAIVSKPKGSGLYILDKEISIPDDVLIFQIGEVMELITDGAIRATEHFVKKAYDGYGRYTFAFFCDPPFDLRINCSNPIVMEKYKDRYTPNMTYEEWNDRSIRLHSL